MRIAAGKSHRVTAWPGCFSPLFNFDSKGNCPRLEGKMWGFRFEEPTDTCIRRIGLLQSAVMCVGVLCVTEMTSPVAGAQRGLP